MKNYLLDTNIIVTYARSIKLADQLEKTYNLFNDENYVAISVVTLGELNSLTRQYNYGLKRQTTINSLVELVYPIDINTQAIIDRYGEIDAYSQNKLNDRPLKMTSRNMGKNDLWIAATASVYDLTLVTMDKDFNHLKDVFLDLILIEQ